MTATVAAMVLAVVAALVVISVFSSRDQDDWAETRPRQPQDAGETHLGDLLDP